MKHHLQFVDTTAKLSSKYIVHQVTCIRFDIRCLNRITTSAKQAQHLNEKKCYFESSIVFHCFIVVLFLGSFKDIDIANLPMNKRYLASCFVLLWDAKLHFSFKAEWPHEMSPPLITFCFDHFTVENHIDAKIKRTTESLGFRWGNCCCNWFESVFICWHTYYLTFLYLAKKNIATNAAKCI